MKLHPFAQVKRVFEAVLGNIPARGQARYDVGRAFFELSQPVVQRLGGVVVGRSGVLRRVETGGAAFGAEHQAVVGGLADGSGGQQAGAQQCG
ncbi:hypothetical protein D3C79_906900 [compost metagenome]